MTPTGRTSIWLGRRAAAAGLLGLGAALSGACDLDWDTRTPPELFTCGPNQTCTPFTCTGSAENGRCLVECGTNSVCTVDCGPATSCEVECGANAQCAVSCADADSCSMDCDANASGLLDCTTAGSCSLSTVTSGCAKQ